MDMVVGLIGAAYAVAVLALIIVVLIHVFHD